MTEKSEKLIEELKELVVSLRYKTDSPESDEKRKQLQAVEKSVQQMQRSGVAVPDELRHLKTKLVGELAETHICKNKQD